MKRNKLLRENPNVIYVPSEDEYYEYDTYNTIPFSYYNGHLTLGKTQQYHGELVGSPTTTQYKKNNRQ